jgi:hypothetical protein
LGSAVANTRRDICVRKQKGMLFLWVQTGVVF